MELKSTSTRSGSCEKAMVTVLPLDGKGIAAVPLAAQTGAAVAAAVAGAAVAGAAVAGGRGLRGRRGGGCGSRGATSQQHAGYHYNTY